MGLLAEIPYPRIDPILLDLGPVKVRWYGVSYVMAFAAAYFVLRMLARRGRWPVPAEKVADVLFWGILGVFLGGRIGYILFYQLPMGTFDWAHSYRVWEGGMSFHGGLLGVVIAYLIFAWRTKTPVGELFDGLTLATPLGIFFVRMANFVNAELPGRPWDGAWAMRFPDYYRRSCTMVDGKQVCGRGPEFWEPERVMMAQLRHPSQLYEAFFEGLVMFGVCWWLMLRKGWGGGMVSGVFLIGYGLLRFIIEFTREPDEGLGLAYLDVFTQGQLLCFVMVSLGLVVLWRSRGWKRTHAGLVEPPAA